MTNRMLIGVLVVALALIGAGCDSTANKLEAPSVVATVAGDGGVLHLTWDQITGAESYEVKAGDSIYTTTSTSLDVTNPAAIVEVRAVKGTSKGDSAVVSCGVVETTIDVYGDLSNTHPNGFGFTENGQADTCTIAPMNFGRLDFYTDGKSVAGEMRLVSGGSLNAGRKGNGVLASSGGYDQAKLAVLPVDTLTYTRPSLPVMVDSAYYLRISPDVTGTWSEGDNYAKVTVVSVSGDSLKVTLKLAYQKRPGFRWLAN